MADRLHAYAVSLVYVKVDPEKGTFVTDEEGMITAFTFAEQWLDVACTTGTAMAPTPELAVLEVRNNQNKGEYLYQGWFEQIVQVHEIKNLESWWGYTKYKLSGYSKWLLWRGKRALRQCGF